MPKRLNGLRITSERFHHHLTSMQRDMDLLLPWLLPVSQPPALFVQAEVDSLLAAAWQALLAALPTCTPFARPDRDLRQRSLPVSSDLQTHLQPRDSSTAQVQAAQAWCAQFTERLNATQAQVNALLIGYQILAARAETRFQAMDFGFLFNAQRKVFHIGYNVTGDKLDDNFYDLLASEARLASLSGNCQARSPAESLAASRPTRRTGERYVSRCSRGAGRCLNT